MIDIAKAGGGIGIFPRPMVRGEVASGALAPIDGMPALAPVEFHVAMRVADTEPVLTQIFERAAKLNLVEEIGRADVRTPVTNAHLVCRLLLDKKNVPNSLHITMMTSR